MEAGTCKISGLGALAVHQVEDGTSFFFCSRGPSHMQRLFAALLIQKFDEEKRQAAKVIAMQVAQEDDIELARIKSELLEREQRSRAAVEQEQAVRGLD